MTLIRPRDLTPSQIINLIDRSRSPLATRSDLEWLGLAFFEPSTRTKLSFYAAARDVGYKILDLPEGKASSLIKGETQDDTVRNMIEIADLKTVVIRSKDEELIFRMAREYPEVRFINAGNGSEHHPTQALGDLLTLADHFGGWEELPGKTVTILGDVAASRVAHSCSELLSKFGIRIGVGGPDEFMSDRAELKWAKRFDTLEEALDKSHVIMALRLQHERRDGNSREIIRQMIPWKIGADDLKTRPNLRIMHPGPVNRGVELTSEAVDSMQSLILTQVRNGYKMRRALLED